MRTLSSNESLGELTPRRRDARCAIACIVIVILATGCARAAPRVATDEAQSACAAVAEELKPAGGNAAVVGVFDTDVSGLRRATLNATGVDDPLWDDLGGESQATLCYIDTKYPVSDQVTRTIAGALRQPTGEREPWQILAYYPPAQLPVVAP